MSLSGDLGSGWQDREVYLQVKDRSHRQTGCVTGEHRGGGAKGVETGARDKDQLCSFQQNPAERFFMYFC